MVKTLINDTPSPVFICEEVTEAQPLVLALENVEGQRSIPLHFDRLDRLQSVCIGKSTQNGVYGVPVYSSGRGAIKTPLWIGKLQDTYYVAMALSHCGQSASLLRDPEGRLSVEVMREPGEFPRALPFLLCLQGDQLYRCLNLAMRLALKLSGKRGKLPAEKPPLPGWMGGLGWSSGLAYGSDITHEKVLSAIWSLREKGLQPSYVIVEEGWQQFAINPFSNRGALCSFEADPIKFPFGIKGVIEELNRAGVEHVGFTHGLIGGRGGVHPELGCRYDLSPDSQGRYILGADLGESFRFYHDFYAYLRAQGVSFVQVGDQCSIDELIAEEVERGGYYENLQLAIQAASGVHLHCAHLNVDCLNGSNLFHWSTSRLARSSVINHGNDEQDLCFLIRDHLINSTWLGHLMDPEYGAWLTDTGISGTLAAFHALSGALNMIGDPSGQHNEALLHRMIAPGGQVLKTDRSATLCTDSFFSDPLKEAVLYKAFSFVGEAGVLAVFHLNCEAGTIQGRVSARDLAGFNTEKYALYSDRRGFLGIFSHGEEVGVELDYPMSDLYTFVPVVEGIALIGSPAYYLTRGVVEEVSIEDEGVLIKTLAAAPLILYCERKVLEIRRSGSLVPWDYDSDKRLLSIDPDCSLQKGPVSYHLIFEE